jgi:integrase
MPGATQNDALVFTGASHQSKVRTLGAVHPHMLRAAFIMAALDAGVPLRDVQLAARHPDPRTTTIYDRRRENYDRHAAYVVVAFVAGGSGAGRHVLGKS